MASTGHRQRADGGLPRKAARVRDAALPGLGGGSVPLRHTGREATVLVRLHDGRCEECMKWVDGLDEAADELRNWYARVMVVVPGNETEARPAADRVRDALVHVVADPKGQGPLAEAGGAAWMVFDRYGEVFHAEEAFHAEEVSHAEAVEGHGLPDTETMRSWLVYLATQCPECGVPDEAWSRAAR